MCLPPLCPPPVSWAASRLQPKWKAFESKPLSHIMRSISGMRVRGSLTGVRLQRTHSLIKMPQALERPPLCVSHYRLRADSEVPSRAVRPSVHRLSAEQGQADHGLQVQGQQRLRQGRLPGLSQESLQHPGLRHQEGPQRQQQEALPEDALSDALQTYERLTAQAIMMIITTTTKKNTIPTRQLDQLEQLEMQNLSVEMQAHEGEEALGPVCGQSQRLNWRRRAEREESRKITDTTSKKWHRLLLPLHSLHTICPSSNFNGHILKKNNVMFCSAISPNGHLEYSCSWMWEKWKAKNIIWCLHYTL